MPRRETAQQIRKDLGISASVQRRIRKILTDKGVLETEKRGNPAKNYYRVHLDKVVECLIEEHYEPASDDDDAPLVVRDVDINDPVVSDTHHQSFASRSTSGADHDALVVRDDDHRVNKQRRQPVNINVHPFAVSDGIRAPQKLPKKTDPVNVLSSERFEKALAYIQETYPLNQHGLGATEWYARKALKKLGDVKQTASEEERAAATERLNALRRGIKNIREAVDAGDLETRYVPGFEKFAGVKIMYGEEPAYVKWSQKRTPPRTGVQPTTRFVV